MTVVLTQKDKEKREELRVLLEKAALIVDRYIEKFKDDKEYILVIEDLKRGHSNLVNRSKLFYENEELFLSILSEDNHKRGGFGLSRGFGEFLRALPKEDEYWASEIMDAVHAIEDYYRSM